MIPDKYDEYRIEHAISFLFQRLSTSNNPKPVGLHSIRVAVLLWSLEFNEDVVIAGVLHDIVEDTDTLIDEIRSLYGKQVADIVDACTFDVLNHDYSDRLSKAKASIDKAVENGIDALLVKAADFIDNANYYQKVDNNELKVYLKAKFEYFMKESKDLLNKTEIWELLQSTYSSNVKSLTL